MTKQKAEKGNQSKESETKISVNSVHTEQLPFYEGGGFWMSNWWKVLLIFILPLVLYYQSTSYGFVLDDQIVISENNFTKQGVSGIDDLLTTESMTGYFGKQVNKVEGNRYRPLSLITFAIEHEIAGGLHPWLHHLINILLYGLTGLLLFRVLAMMLRKTKPSFSWLSIPLLTALFFVAHPIHSEAVANIKGRDEIMALLLSLSTLYASLRYMDYRKIVWLITSGVLFFLALLSKENSITFLAVVPLSIYFFSEYKNKYNFINLGVLLATTVVYLIVRTQTAGFPEFGKEITDLMNNPFLGMSGGERMATIMFTLWKYIQLYIFPHPLTHDYYPYAIPVLGWADLRSIGPFLLYVAMGVLALWGMRKKRIWSYAILFYLATLSIVSNIVINLGTFMNERFIYMASVGLALLMAYWISEKLAKWNGQTGMFLASGLSLLMILGYAFKTYTRVPDWENALTLNTSAVRYGTNSARANSFMATAMYNKGREHDGKERLKIFEEGYEYAEKAIRIHPKYQNANLMKAGLAAEIHKIDRNEELLLQRFAEVMKNRPDVSFINEYLEYLENRSDNIDGLIDWYAETSVKVVLQQANMPKWALHYLNRAFKLDNDNQKVLVATSIVYNALGDKARAQSFQQRAQLQLAQ